MTKNKSLSAHFKKLKALAFNRAVILKEISRDLHTRATQYNCEWSSHLLEMMTVPFTLWGSDFQRLAEHACELLAEGRELPAQMQNILRNYAELPSEELINVIILEEKEVQDGNYNQHLTKEALTKYDTANKIMLSNPEVHADVTAFFERNPEFCPRKKVMRRRMCMERNFRQPGWEYDRNNPQHLPIIEFDSLCAKHMLFGVQRNADGTFTPLLQKLSVNVTPYGILVFIPRYWSLDARRDVKWGEVNKLLRAWGIKRQGIKWSTTRLANNTQSRLAAAADTEASEMGLTGEDRYNHIKEKAGLHPDMDPGSLYRIVRAGYELMGKKKPN